MANRVCKIIGIGVLTIWVLQFQKINAQQPTLSEFFDKLRTIEPVNGNLHYDTFPDFDFTKFEPLQKSYGSKKASYVVGSNHDGKIRTVIFFKENGIIGTMDVYNFQSFSILTFKKAEAPLAEYPDFPIFCVSKNSRFVVYLNKRFEYQQKYKPEDIASVQILRDDLFPVYALTVKDNYIRMLFEVNYVNGRSKFIDKVRVIVVFQPEKDKQLLVSGQSQFSEECYMPKADFIGTLHPKIESDGMPYWFHANSFNE